MFAPAHSFACGPPDARPPRGTRVPPLEVNGFIEECFTDARGAP